MICILLATYEGSKYIKEQIDSILNQKEEEFILYIHDDGSKDETVNIVKGYEKKFPNKIVVVEGESTGSAKDNFFYLLGQCTGKYYFFADQDDIWYPNKLTLTMEKMRELEKKDSNIPILIHTDLQVIDEMGKIIAPSFFDYQNLPYEHHKLNELLVQNTITGCTVGINHKAKEYLSHTEGKSILMHDWWIGLVVASFGKIGHLKTSTLGYRQHGGNQVGAQNAKSGKYIWDRVKKSKENKNSWINTLEQGAYFLSVYGDKLREEEIALLKDFSGLKKGSKIRKIQIINKHKLWKKGLIKKIGQIVYL